MHVAPHGPVGDKYRRLDCERKHKQTIVRLVTLAGMLLFGIVVALSRH